MENEVKLTKLASCAGCGAKVGAGTLCNLLEGFQTHYDERLLVGYDKSDDASVYQVSEELAIVQTTDLYNLIAIAALKHQLLQLRCLQGLCSLQLRSLKNHTGAAAAAQVSRHRHHAAGDAPFTAELLVPHRAEVGEKGHNIRHLVKVSVHSPSCSLTAT